MFKVPAYPTLDGLVDLACRDGVDIRPTLLRVLTDLYVQKPVHSADEEVQYVELALGLIETVDATTRATVAARLATYPRAPAAVLRKLAGQPRRVGLAPRPDPRNPDKAATRPASAIELVELFFAAGADERRLILTNLDAAPGVPVRPTLAHAPDTAHRLETAALQRNPGEFTRTLEQALAITRTLAHRIVGDPSGEPVVVATKALGLKADALQRILLFLNPDIGLSVQRVYDLAALFDEITLAAAEQMAAIWQQSIARVRPPHSPLHWDDERRSARAAASPQPHRATPKEAVTAAETKSRRG